MNRPASKRRLRAASASKSAMIQILTRQNAALVRELEASRQQATRLRRRLAAIETGKFGG